MPDVPRQADPSEVRYPITIVAAPKNRRPIKVRFLGEVRGTLTHYHPDGSFICQHPSKCKECGRGERVKWKGYAPALYYCEAPFPHWRACVFEVTDKFGEAIQGKRMTATEWSVCRVADGPKRAIVQGQRTAVLDPRDLPAAHEIEPALHTVYGRVELLLDRDSLTPKTEYARPIPVTRLSDGPSILSVEGRNQAEPEPEPVSDGPEEATDPKSYDAVRGRLLNFGKMPNGNGSANGRH